MTETSWRVAENLWLAGVALPDSGPAPLPPRAHRIFVCDVSGSMSGDLPALRQHLKDNLDRVVRDDDTITVVWFSGRGQFGVVAQAMTVRDADDRAELFAAVDRRLRPVGLTGFREPLEDVARVISSLRSLNPDCVFSLTFMSDGHDNQWSVQDVMGAVSAIAPDLAAATVVEYGWYANRPLLVRMAEELGGEYAFARDMSGFVPILDGSLSAAVVGGVSRREVVLSAAPLHGVAFAPSGAGGLLAWKPGSDNAIRVPADLRAVWFLSDRPVGAARDLGDARAAEPEAVCALYAAAAMLAQRMLSDDLLRVLAALGDKAMVDMFAACFGKQQYSDFREALLAASADPALRWAGGWDPKAVPADDAFTVLDLLGILGAPGNTLRLDHPAWDYSPIGRKTVFAGDRVSEEDREAMADAAAAAARAGDLAAVRAALEAAEAKAVREYRFRPTGEPGVPMTSLVLHESRPNVSVQTVQHGVLELGDDGAARGLPAELPAHRFRNYAVLRDGIVNVDTLPVQLTEQSHAALAAVGRVAGPWDKDDVYPVSVRGLPVVNRRMVRAARAGARELFSLEWDLLKAQAAQKVWKHFQAQVAPRSRTDGLAARHGEATAEWLKSIGLTDGGYAPRRAVAAVSDSYTGRELKVSIKGFSSLPKVEEVAEALDGGKKMTPSRAMMAPIVRAARHVLATLTGDALAQRLRTEAEAAVTEARRLNARLSEIKFAVVVGQVWFEEFESPDEGTLSMMDDDGTEYVATAHLREMEVKI